MGQKRRIVSKVDRSLPASFDDQMWPVNLALLVLAGFTAGIILVKSNFNDPRILANGWVRLIGLGFSTVGLLVLAHFLNNHRLARRLQLAVLISVMLHLGLALFMNEAYMTHVAKQQADQRRTHQLEPMPTLPEYHFRNPEESPQQEFEKPVETKSPEKPSDQPDREPTEQKESAAIEQPVALPEPEKETDPTPVKLARQQIATPRRADTSSKLSKQSEVARSQPDTAIAAPSQELATNEKQAPTPSPQAAPVERASADSNVPRRDTPQEVQSPNSRSAVKIANRADTPRPQATVSSTATLPKQVAQPADTPAADAPREVAARPQQQEQPKQPSPQAKAEAQVVAGSPQVTKQPTEPTPDPPTPVRQADAARQQPTERQPTIAAARETTPNKQRIETSVASEAPIVPKQVAAQKPTPNATPAPQQNEVARQSTRAEAKPATTAAATPTAESSVTSAVTPRAQASTVPTLAPQQQPTTKPQRAAATAEVAQARAAQAESPTAAAESSQPNPSPAATQVAKASPTATATPQATADTSQTRSDVPSPVAAVTRSQQSQNQPTVAAASAATPTRQAAPTTLNTAAAETPASVATANNPTPAATPQATTGEVARQMAAVPTRNNSATPTTATPGEIQNNSTSPALARSENRATAPSITPETVANNTPRQAAVASQVAATPLAQPATAGTTNAAANAARSPSPTSTAVARSQTGGPQVKQSAAEPSLDSPTAVAATNPGRKQDSPQSQPSLASSNVPTPTRRQVDTSISTTNAEAAPASAAAAQTAASSVPAPQATNTPRAATQVASQTSAQTPATNLPQLETAALSRSVARNAQPAPAPSLTPSTAPTDRPRQTQEVSIAAASPSTVESPAVEVAANQASPTARPASSALNRATAGMVGAGASQNADIETMASPENSAAVAASAARRATPLQREAGPSLAPSEPAQIAKSTAGADAPTAIFKADDVAVADVTGARETSQLAASASAAVERSGASAPLSNLTAAAGKLEVDTGTTQIVPEAGAGRAAGGGQPQIALNAQTEKVARARAGGAPVASIAANIEQPTPSAPKETGGGSPEGPQVNLTADAQSRASGAPLPNTATPSAAPAGAASSENTPVAAAQLERASAGGAAGGQPELGTTPPGQKVERTLAGAPALATLASDLANPTASAPMATGGGSPDSPQPSAVAEAGRQDSGAPRVTQAGEPAPSGAEAAAGGTASQLAAAAITRAEAAAAGGAPQVANEEKSISKTPANAAAVTSLAAAVAPTTAAPAGDGGGSPPGPIAVTAESAAGERVASPTGPTLAQQSAAPPAASGGTEGEVASATITRATAGETLPGVNAGGGTDTPARNRGAAAALLTKADVPQMESVPQEGGAEAGQPLSSQGTEIARAASGLPGKVATGPTGAEAAPASFDSDLNGAPGISSQVAEAARGAAAAPTLGNEGEASAPVPRGETAMLTGGVSASAEMLDLGTTSAESGASKTPAAGPEVGEDAPSRIPGAIPVRVSAESGIGGLGPRPTLEIGIPSRHAQRDSLVAKIEPGKFMLKKEGGAAALSGMARDIAPAFAKRGDRSKDSDNGGAGRPSAKTEAAVESGVDFLSRHQMEDGRWSFHSYGVGKAGFENEFATIEADTAATGLALLAFLGAGYDHLDDKHQQRVAAGLDYLVRNQKENGDLYLPQDQETNQVAALYSHGIASIALCEAYGMTGDPRLKEAAQKAIDFIVAAQHKDRGGWRYTPNYSSDLSVTGWQLMALKSGELAGLNVPKETYSKVVKFLDRCAIQGGSLYAYNPDAGNDATQRHGKGASTVMTGVGLLMRQYTGWTRDRAEMKKGADHLLANLPAYGTSAAPALTGTLKNPYRDTYYWYYTTQFMFHMKGKYWKAWNEKLHPLLTDTQIVSGPFAGSWDPIKPIPDKWGAQGGRIYLTTMNILSLEVYYRHLPIYENTAK